MKRELPQIVMGFQWFKETEGAINDQEEFDQ